MGEALEIVFHILPPRSFLIKRAVVASVGTKWDMNIEP
jgi:hypothetical protein